ncbi:MAG: hypothetical protein IT432_07150 [Phycisphaerales bacterium]|nr:hypothetical protein [Phycisphaerales bacterium]
MSFYIGSDENTTGPDFVNADDIPVKKGGLLRGIVATGLGNPAGSTTSQLYGGVNGDFGQATNPNDYSIHVTQLARFDVGGGIYGDFSVSSPGGTANSPVFVIEGNGFSDDCQITLNSGTIKRIKSVDDMKAKIIVENGDIDLIDAGARITGYGPEPLWVKKGRIKKILAAQEISQFTGSGLNQAMIRANEGIDFIETPFIDGYIIANDASNDTVTDGSIRHIKTTDSTSGIRTHATIVASKIISDSTNDGRVTVSGSLNGELVIGNSTGLSGQVIINAANGSGTWSDKVFVGSVELSSTSHGAPYYDVASSSLGGGAVGLVPYHLYGVDCQPVSGSSILDSAFNQKLIGGFAGYNTSIKLRFYGPVFQNDTDPAIKVEQLLGSEWIDLTDRAVVTFGSATGGNPREITIHGTDGTTGKIPFLPGPYRITGVAGKLKCGGTPADPVPDSQTNFTYDFSLTSDCNKNNRDDATDLAETVTYEGDTYHPYNLNENDFIDACDRETHGTCPADIDGNGFINALDYDWFAVLFEIGHPLADIDANGFVNALDYDLFSGLFETACQ